MGTDSVSATMSDTTTVSTDLRLAVCACCADHSDWSLTSEIVTCRMCGGLCSCEGCVAEASNDE